MTIADEKPYASDLKEMERVWGEYVRKELGRDYRGEVRDGENPKRRASIDRIDIIDGGPGGRYDVTLVVVRVARRHGDLETRDGVVWKRRYDVLDKMLVRDAAIQENRSISEWERNRRSEDLWRNTLTYDIQDSIREGGFPSLRRIRSEYAFPRE